MWAWLGTFRDKVAAFFRTDAGAIVKQSIAGLLKVAGPIAIGILLPEALKQVKIQELQGGLSGAMKADRVRQYLQEYAKQQGIEIGAKAVNSLIEHAVMSLES